MCVFACVCICVLVCMCVCVCVCVCACVRLLSFESRVHYTSASNYVATNTTLHPMCLHCVGIQLVYIFKMARLRLRVCAHSVCAYVYVCVC